ncbi:MAG: peptidylprolyl isomerase [Planctomycetota bacterium]
MSMRTLFLSAAIAATLLGARAHAQSEDESPIDLPMLRDDAVVVQPLEYDKTLPSAPVATIDGVTLTQADLLKELLTANLQTISNTLLMTKMVDLELEREDMKVADSAVEAELADMLPRMAPGKTLDELLATGIYSRSYLERIARMNAGWKQLFWKAKNIPEESRADQANQLLMQLFVNEVKNRYQLALRGQEPAPPAGSVAALNTIVRGKRVSYVVSTAEAIEFLVGLLRPATILQGQNTLVDNALVRRALEAAGASVSDTEVEAWVKAQHEKYPPPFTWETILRIKGTTPDGERNRWRNVQAWKRSNGIQIGNDELETFRSENEDYFRSRHVKVSHILISTADPITGLPLPADQCKEAEERAATVARLAQEGVDFSKLAQRFSDDTSTATAGGNMQQPIKKWGGGYDPDFQKAAYAMKKGEISSPVKSQFGYHVILCNEVSEPTRREINWNDARYAEWILEEYETKKMEAWLEGLRAKAKIELVGPEELFKLKKAEFPKREDG